MQIQSRTNLVMKASATYTSSAVWRSSSLTSWAPENEVLLQCNEDHRSHGEKVGGGGPPGQSWASAVSRASFWRRRGPWPVRLLRLCRALPGNRAGKGNSPALAGGRPQEELPSGCFPTDFLGKRIFHRQVSGCISYPRWVKIIFSGLEHSPSPLFDG